jgi:hypothetical protein
MRTVAIRLSEGFIDTMEAKGNRQEVNKVIGYLTTWAIGSERYTHCNLYGHDNGCIDAIYHSGDKTDGQPVYAMGAIVADDGTYSTHS